MASSRHLIAGTVAAAVAAVAAAQAPPSIRWRDADSHLIDACRMVFDGARDRFVAQGAPNTMSPLFTVEWDGHRWETRRTAAAPTARAGFGLAYDMGRSRVVLFGGSLNGSNSAGRNDVWEYDGLDWVDRSPAVRPPARQRLAMTYDLARGRVLMAGGLTATSTASTDTWWWDGSAWQLLAATAPPLTDPEMSSHPSTQRVVMVGVRSGACETWTFDGTNWTQAAPAHSPPISTYRLTTDLANDRVVLLVCDQGTLLDWNGVDWTARPTAFDRRRDCGFAADGAGRVLAFAGTMFSPIGILGELLPLTDTWALDATGATKLADGGPRNQLEIQVAYDLARNRIVCVGGRGTGATPTPTLEHDGTAWHVTTPTTPPAALQTRLCHDFLRGRTVRFGGYRLSGFAIVPNNELSEWDGAQWQTVTASGPTPRWNHAMAFDLARGAVLLFGGMGQGNVLLGDTWQWDGSHWSQLATIGPAPRTQHAMAFDPLRLRAVLFGGTLAGNLAVLGDT